MTSDKSKKLIKRTKKRTVKSNVKKTRTYGGSLYIKKNVKKEEYILQKLAYDNGIPTSKPIKWENNILTMEKIDGLSVNDMYGDTKEGFNCSA